MIRGRHFEFVPDGSDTSLSLDDQIDELDAVVKTAVRRAMISDVPLGALLSSGVDSSLVTAVACALQKRPLRTFSIGFDATAEFAAELKPVPAALVPTQDPAGFRTGLQELKLALLADRDSP